LHTDTAGTDPAGAATGPVAASGCGPHARCD